MSDISLFIAHNFQSRLLERLNTLRAPLLSKSLLHRNFYPHGFRISESSQWGGSVEYVCTCRPSAFEPVFFGVVKSINQWGSGLGIDVQLGLPRYATNTMDVLFWNQFSTLQAIMDTDNCASGADPSSHNILPWCSPGAGEGHSYDDRTITLDIPSRVEILRCTPRTVSAGVDLAPVSPLSSCTLTSQNGSLHPVSVGDVLVARTTLSCVDYPCENAPTVPTVKSPFIRLYSVTTTLIEVVV
ncbi:hypothetical protein B0H17DRAFT_1148604 [Mycena rosella]|uniref:Uncharacterized protein n=1 Tax=Mycena rosella TaxID=1033263 RepID=A0AAD7FU37_MYCRO|nr:hypothetical protein B0H17DRAFT_1148604 [Mycena rosella]